MGFINRVASALRLEKKAKLTLIQTFELLVAENSKNVVMAEFVGTHVEAMRKSEEMFLDRILSSNFRKEPVKYGSFGVRVKA